MRIDLAIPTYRYLSHPRHKQAMDNAIGYSGCSCFQRSTELAEQLYAAAASGKRFHNLPPENPFHHPSDCPKGKHDISVISQPNGSVVHWSRNNLLTRRRPDADYVLFCDDDIVVPHDTIERMLSHKKDIVAGLCTKRVDPPEPVILGWSEQLQDYVPITYWPLNKLLEVDAVGTGLIMLSRQVIEDVAMNYHPRTYRGDGKGWWFEFLRAPCGGEWGEDVSFCFKATRIGYRIFADTSIAPEHMGEYGYSAADFLEYRDAIDQAGGLAAFRAQEQRKLLVPSEAPESGALAEIT